MSWGIQLNGVPVHRVTKDEVGSRAVKLEDRMAEIERGIIKLFITASRQNERPPEGHDTLADYLVDTLRELLDEYGDAAAELRLIRYAETSPEDVEPL